MIFRESLSAPLELDPTFIMTSLSKSYHRWLMITLCLAFLIQSSTQLKLPSNVFLQASFTSHPSGPSPTSVQNPKETYIVRPVQPGNTTMISRISQRLGEIVSAASIVPITSSRRGIACWVVTANRAEYALLARITDVGLP